VSLPFDRSEWFSFDKPADVPCRHLQPTNRCSIHEQLSELGQAGCAHYDCYGAGQRLTQELGPGHSWRADPERAHQVFAAFRQLKTLHELRLLLHEARALGLAAQHVQELELLLAQLEPETDFDAEALGKVDVAELERAVHTFLRGLGGYVTRRRRLPLWPPR